VEAEGDVVLDTVGDPAGALELSEGALVLEVLIELHGGIEVALEVVSGERAQRTAHQQEAEGEPEGGSTRRGEHGEGY
jgi:hypothetical protein